MVLCGKQVAAEVCLTMLKLFAVYIYHINVRASIILLVIFGGSSSTTFFPFARNTNIQTSGDPPIITLSINRIYHSLT